MLADPANRAIAIERNPERAARIGRNALALGVPPSHRRRARAAALAGLPQPRAIFVGGGAARPAPWRPSGVAAPGGRLVVNAVTLETQAELAPLASVAAAT